MIRTNIVSSACALLMVSGCASFHQQEVSDNSCSKELGACLKEERGCVMMGIPQGAATCDVDCQAQVLKKLYLAGISATFHTGAPSGPLGCVGYRTDLGGTKEGAQCIARMLDYKLYPVGCNEDGFPYNVRVH